LSLAEAYDYMQQLVGISSERVSHVAIRPSLSPLGTTEVFKKAFNHVRNFGNSSFCFKVEETQISHGMQGS